MPPWIQGVVRWAFGAVNNRMYVWPQHVRYVNLLKPLPFADNSVDAVYASHVWEHLYYRDSKRVTKELVRILKPGGILRLCVPNVEYCCRQYLAELGSDQAAVRLNEGLLFREMSRPTGLKALYAAMGDFHSHKFMFDEASLCALLREASFSDVERKEALDSRIPEISEVESIDRVHPAGLAVEAVKPLRP